MPDDPDLTSRLSASSRDPLLRYFTGRISVGLPPAGAGDRTSRPGTEVKIPLAGVPLSVGYDLRCVWTVARKVLRFIASAQAMGSRAQYVFKLFIRCNAGKLFGDFPLAACRLALLRFPPQDSWTPSFSFAHQIGSPWAATEKIEPGQIVQNPAPSSHDTPARDENDNSQSPEDRRSSSPQRPTLSPLAAIASPNDQPYSWTFSSSLNNSLRAGPLSPAMLAGPQPTDHNQAHLQFDPSSFHTGLIHRTGLTPPTGLNLPTASSCSPIANCIQAIRRRFGLKSCSSGSRNAIRREVRARFLQTTAFGHPPQALCQHPGFSQPTLRLRPRLHATLRVRAISLSSRSVSLFETLVQYTLAAAVRRPLRPPTAVCQHQYL
ncbi:hypothetical protein DFH09DRAFT_1363419 [Mycena vulgaris]|nr:hypothetical protein DFH09DRAFT_1363419 [Mycena vulgaris]